MSRSIRAMHGDGTDRWTSQQLLTIHKKVYEKVFSFIKWKPILNKVPTVCFSFLKNLPHGSMWRREETSNGALCWSRVRSPGKPG